MAIGMRHFDSSGVRHLQGSKTFCASLLTQLIDEIERTSRISYPATQFQQRGPNGETGIEVFAREVLGSRTWSKQRELYEAVTDALKPDSNRKRIVVQSSQKSSKSYSWCVITLYLMYCFEEPYQILMVGPAERTTKNILWPQLHALIRQSGTCLSCKESKIKCPHANPLPMEYGFPRDPTTGFVSGAGNFSTVYGLTANTDREKLAGFSGIEGRLVIIMDEASGVDEAGVWAVCEGNLAGAAHGFFGISSNPTKTKGPYHKHCTDKIYQSGQHLIHISAYDSLKDPEAALIPGLARKQWIDKMVKEGGGLEANEVRIRVRGLFPKQEGEGGYFTGKLIEDAIAKWTPRPDGKVVIGCDPAGPGQDADDTAFCVLIGNTVVELPVTDRPLSADNIFDEILGLAERYSPDRTWWLTWDGGGPVGHSLTEVIRSRATNHPLMVWKRGKNISSDKDQVLEPTIYDRVRDEMTARVRERLVDGMALPPGSKELAEEMLAISMTQNAMGLMKMTPRQKLVKALHRSPDRFSALAVACYLEPRDPVTVTTGSAAPMSHADSVRRAVEQSRAQVQDPRRALGSRW
ncbi:MAG: hypothetical protein ACOYBP_08875 [Microbacteriaceae bacterium]